MRKIFFASAMLIATCIIGCKGKDAVENTPTKVLSSFFEAVNKKDISAAKDLATKESQKFLSLVEFGINKNKKSIEMFDASKLEFGEPVIDGDKAKISIKQKLTGDVVNFPMKKEDGQWKVIFDESSMMEMASDKIKDLGTNVKDSLDKFMNKFKSMNLDSLKQEIDKAMNDENVGNEKMEKVKKEMDSLFKEEKNKN
jgi:Domain of unknown function (DUF4878)